MIHMYDLERSIDKAQDCIDDEFKSACSSTKALKIFFSSDKRPSKNAMFQAACSAMLDDEVKILKLIYEHGDLTDFSKGLLSTAIIDDAKCCFNYLTIQARMSIDILKYYNVYEKAKKMQAAQNSITDEEICREMYYNPNIK